MPIVKIAVVDPTDLFIRRGPTVKIGGMELNHSET